MPGMRCCSLSALSAATSEIAPDAASRDARRPPCCQRARDPAPRGSAPFGGAGILPSCFFSLIRRSSEFCSICQVSENCEPFRSEISESALVTAARASRKSARTGSSCVRSASQRQDLAGNEQVAQVGAAITTRQAEQLHSGRAAAGQRG